MAIKIKPLPNSAAPAPKMIDSVTDGKLTMEVYEHDDSPPTGKPKAYRITDLEFCASDEAALNEVVFTCLKHDYGVAGDDTKLRGVKHVSVTFKPDGDYPFFTIPLQHLKPL
jgi:hypothetical protein